MLKNSFYLSKALSGMKVKLVSIEGGQALRRRLTDIGLNEGCIINVFHANRFGPCVVFINNTKLVLGHGMANKIRVEEV